MGDKTGIDWTQATWNPTTGCTKVNACCDHCYAETWALKLQKNGNPKYRNGFELTLHEKDIGLPLKWKQPKMIFVNSMSDLFHKEIPFAFIEKCFDVMMLADWHIYQILTKRPSIMRDFVKDFVHRKVAGPAMPKHIWPGVSVGMKHHLHMIDILKEVPAEIRFVSFEPLLESLGKLNLKGISWAIVGGESEPNGNARPMKEEWAIEIIEQCQEQGVSVFFKQWGGKHSKSRGPMNQEHDVIRNTTYKEYPLTLKNLNNEVLI